MTRRQCAKCPWKKGVDANAIPGGYSRAKHKKLASTIAEPGSMAGAFGGTARAMACHETTGGAELACVGWLVNQLGPGNNIALRLRVVTGNVDGDVETVGPQHERFEDTIPKRRRTSVAGRDYVLHLTDGAALTLCGRRRLDVNCSTGKDPDETLCMACVAARSRRSA